MKIQWLGHACFAIILADGRTVLTDPFYAKLGYPPPDVAADVVTISHQHFDHNALDQVRGTPIAYQEAGEHSLDGIGVKGVPAFHDNAQGAQRGKNIIYVIEAEGIKVCHLGDLGHMLEPGQVKSIGAVDVLLLPVGGFYTIGADEASTVVRQLNPKYIIPMHFKTDYISLAISSPEAFLINYPDHLTMSELVLTKDSLPTKQEVVCLTLKNP